MNLSLSTHPESDSATHSGHKQVPTGCAQDESDKKSVSSKKWNALHNTNH